jgi:hypothetical protein
MRRTGAEDSDHEHAAAGSLVSHVERGTVPAAVAVLGREEDEPEALQAPDSFVPGFSAGMGWDTASQFPELPSGP